MNIEDCSQPPKLDHFHNTAKKKTHTHTEISIPSFSSLLHLCFLSTQYLLSRAKSIIFVIKHYGRSNK